jgi:hypothetical protein
MPLQPAIIVSNSEFNFQRLIRQLETLGLQLVNLSENSASPIILAAAVLCGETSEKLRQGTCCAEDICDLYTALIAAAKAAESAMPNPA